MAVLLNLNPLFAEEVISVVEKLYFDGYIYVPYNGLRSYEDQLSKWLVGRDPISWKVTGKVITYKKPGTSFHEFGAAVDVYKYVVGGKADWNANSYIPLVNEIKKSNTIRLAGSNFELGHLEWNVSLENIKNL